MKTLFATLIAATALLSTTAHAGTCPWGDADGVAVAATGKAVSINGAAYPVKGKLARESFARTLSDCGQSDAREAFTSWRLNRRLTNWSIAAGVVSGGILLPVAIVPAVIAGKRQEQMVGALEGAGSVARR